MLLRVYAWDESYILYLTEDSTVRPGFLSFPELRGLMFKTADLCDRHQRTINVATPLFRAYGKNIAFSGPIRTVKVHEDNVLVKQALSGEGAGAVLIVDGGASLRCALLGDQLAALAANNGWSGLVVNGCIRDVEAINKIALGIRALGPHPLRSAKKGAGAADIPVRFADVTFMPGHHLYAMRMVCRQPVRSLLTVLLRTKLRCLFCAWQK